MARARNIKPGFFINDQLAEIEPLGRLLFAGLWTIADREGRLEDRPKKIKVAILPYDDCDIDQLLNALNDAGFISRYMIDGQNYIQIINFEKHQNPHPREVASVIPAQTFLVTDKATPRHDPDNTLQLPSNADSPIPLILISDSLTPITPTPAEEVYEHWNSLKIIIHQGLTNTMEIAINKALKSNTIDEVKESMTHFSIMLKDKGYTLCDYTWGLETFLTRKNGYKLFLNDGEKWINYQNRPQERASPIPFNKDKTAQIDRIFDEMEASNHG